MKTKYAGQQEMQLLIEECADPGERNPLDNIPNVQLRAPQIKTPQEYMSRSGSRGDNSYNYGGRANGHQQNRPSQGSRAPYPSAERTSPRPEAGPPKERLWTNQFEIGLPADAVLNYRLYRIENLPNFEGRDPLLNKLAKTVNYDLRVPVALVAHNGCGHALALPADIKFDRTDYQIGPHVAHLVPEGGSHALSLKALEDDPASAVIAEKFLDAAFRAQLRKNGALWCASGNAFHSKSSRTGQDAHSEIDIYPGFTFGVVVEQGKPFLTLDMRMRCIDRKGLVERARVENMSLNDFKMRHCLYALGDRWFVVQFRGDTGLSISEQQFVKEETGETFDVYAYTRQVANEGRPTPENIQHLDPNSPAIMFRYPGSGVERYGALSLCRLSISTSDSELARAHRNSVLSPSERMRLTRKMITDCFQKATIIGQRLVVANEPLEVERLVFPIPDQLFGHGHVLRVRDDASQSNRSDAPAAKFGMGNEDASEVATPDNEGVVETVPLGQMARRRQELFLSPKAGPYTQTPFDTQLLVLPKSLPREIATDFEQRLTAAMKNVSGSKQYQIHRVLYDDGGDRNTLSRQVSTIQEAIRNAGHRRGYALLVLPRNARKGLHNYVKKTLWPDIQMQCANAPAIMRYYRDGRPVQQEENRLNSYVRNCAFGLMVVNRKWPWALATPLHYDVYIGVDVLNQTAGFTFVYNGARNIYFKHYPCKQAEQLLKEEMQQVIVEDMADHLAELGIRPRSIVVHRDGRTFQSELTGLLLGIKKLQRQGLLDEDVLVGAVDIRKSSVDRARLYEGSRLDRLDNPMVGAYRVRSSKTGIVCTTGAPFHLPGTANPLSLVIAWANRQLDMKKVLQDAYALSLGVYTAPDRCARLPLTNKIADDMLEPIAGAVHEEVVEEALVEEVEDEDAEDLREVLSLLGSTAIR